MRRAVDASILDARAAHTLSADARRTKRVDEAGLCPAESVAGGFGNPLRVPILRWVATAIVVLALWACSSHRLAIPEPKPVTVDQRTFNQTVNHKLDILFMVDDSSSMGPLQKKLSAQLGTFMDILTNQTTGRLPDLHVAVVSSSVGGGAWSNVPQCEDDRPPGDDRGKFVQGPGGPGSGSCPMLHPGEKFLSTGDGVKTHPNFDNDIRDAFKCMALLGDKGCGFEGQFKAVAYALNKALDQKDPDNGGFLRDDAVLAIVMLTNEDDCSVPDNSLLLFPAVQTVTDPSGLGALLSYRCNEFGHLCDGQPPPHGYPDPIPAGGLTLNNCVSAEDMSPKTDDAIIDATHPDDSHGHLWPTAAQLTRFLRDLKPGRPNDVLVAAIAGPPTPYRVIPGPSPTGAPETVPLMDHSCTFPSDDPQLPDEYADPGVRIGQWIDAWAPNGQFFSICAKTLTNAIAGIANRINQTLNATCVSTDIAWKDPNKHDAGHDCTASRRASDADPQGEGTEHLVECLPIVTDATNLPTPTNAPCFQLIPNDAECEAQAQAKTRFRVCDNDSCTPVTASTDHADASISCVLP